MFGEEERAEESNGWLADEAGDCYPAADSDRFRDSGGGHTSKGWGRKSEEYLDSLRFSVLMGVGDEQELKNLLFLGDPKEFPFRECLNGAYIDSIEKLSPQINWPEQFARARRYLQRQLERFREQLSSNRKNVGESDPRQPLYRLSDCIRSPDRARKSGIAITESSHGSGGIHFCKDRSQEVVALLKTSNGYAGTIDNSRGFCNPAPGWSCREPLYNYESAQKEALAYELSLAFHLVGSVPPTVLTLVDNPRFHTFFAAPGIRQILSTLSVEVREEIYTLLGGEADSERLSALQEAVRDPIALCDLMREGGEGGDKRFNRERFEDVILLSRILGDTGGGFDNYLAQEEGGEYFIIKVDSGSSMPRGSAAPSCLTALPNGKEPISRRWVERLEACDPEELQRLAGHYGIEREEVDGAKERLLTMKKLVQRYPVITHREFEVRLRDLQDKQDR